MVDLNALAQVLSIRNGVWAAVGLIGIGLYRFWHALPAFMEQLTKRSRSRADIEGEQYERMDARMQRLENRCEELERAHEECLSSLAVERDGRAEEHARRLEAEALLMARQKVDQEAQQIISTERQIDAAKKGKPDG